jgi:hypothetical protein
MILIMMLKSLGQTIVRMANLSSINCFDTHGNGQTDPVIFTGQTHTSQQRLRKSPGPDKCSISKL